MQTVAKLAPEMVLNGKFKEGNKRKRKGLNDGKEKTRRGH